jgi:hypothetical protein
VLAARSFKNRRVGVFGLARSGTACIESLRLGGAEVFGWDDSEIAVAKAREQRLPIGNLRELDFGRLDSLVLSPGVPLTHPEPHWTVTKARVAGIEIIGDTEVFQREMAGTGQVRGNHRHQRSRRRRRWAAMSSLGRRDTKWVAISHGGLPVGAPTTVSSCWNSSFRSIMPTSGRMRVSDQCHARHLDRHGGWTIAESGAHVREAEGDDIYCGSTIRGAGHRGGAQHGRGNRCRFGCPKLDRGIMYSEDAADRRDGTDRSHSDAFAGLA